jgi:fatty-acid desaturase
MVSMRKNGRTLPLGWIVRSENLTRRRQLIARYAHLWGYRNYKTDDDRRNNLVVVYLSYGEGWHNNHHADPSAAHFRRRWWELDFSFPAIRLLQRLGLARDVVLPK